VPTILSLSRTFLEVLRSAGLLTTRLIGPAALSGVLVSLLALVASVMAFLYEQAKSWAGRGEI
jgi:hypothetical protein